MKNHLLLLLLLAALCASVDSLSCCSGRVMCVASCNAQNCATGYCTSSDCSGICRCSRCDGGSVLKGSVGRGGGRVGGRGGRGRGRRVMFKFCLALFFLQLSTVAYSNSQPIERGIIVGGVEDATGEDFEELKWMAIKEINAKSKDAENYVPVKLTKPTTQTVAGSLHTFDLEVGQSVCLKTKVNHEQLKAKPCKLKVKGKKQVHSVKIYLAIQPKDNEVTILSSKNL